jgi:hypothetical protein
MNTLISIKDFRRSLAAVADAVINKKETYTVMRRSHPAFVVKPFVVKPFEEDEESLDELGWKTAIDFTSGGKKREFQLKNCIKR